MREPNPRRPTGISEIPNFQKWMTALRILIDLVASLCGQALGLVVWFALSKDAPSALPDRIDEIVVVGEVVLLLCIGLFGLYVPHRSLLDLHEHRGVLRAWITALAGTRLLLFLMGVPVSVPLLLSIWAMVLPSVHLGRRGFHWIGERLRRAGVGEVAALVYGAGETGIRLVRELRRQPESGVHVVGFVDDGPGEAVRQVEGVPVLCDFSRLDALLSEGAIGKLYIALPQVPRRTILDILAICRRRGVDFRIVPNLAEQHLSLVELQDIDGVPLLGVPSTTMPVGARFRKRILDLALAVPLLVLAAPLLLLAAPFVRRATGGTALVGIPVAGVDGRPFRLLRLRSLPAKFRPELRRIPGDERLPAFCGFCRASLLEIAPELWNVIRGEISMVGPRPLGLREAATLEPRHRFRLGLRPGFTGLWKIDPRRELDPAEELELDLQYLRLRSFLLDIAILLRSMDEILRRLRT